MDNINGKLWYSITLAWDKDVKNEILKIVFGIYLLSDAEERNEIQKGYQEFYHCEDDLITTCEKRLFKSHSDIVFDQYDLYKKFTDEKSYTETEYQRLAKFIRGAVFEICFDKKESDLDAATMFFYAYEEAKKRILRKNYDIWLDWGIFELSRRGERPTFIRSEKDFIREYSSNEKDIYTDIPENSWNEKYRKSCLMFIDQVLDGTLHKKFTEIMPINEFIEELIYEEDDDETIQKVRMMYFFCENINYKKKYAISVKEEVQRILRYLYIFADKN